MKCFYHIDFDGKCAGFWVKEKAQHYDGYEKEFIPIDYGIEFPFDTIQPNEQIYIVDYSILPEEMDRLLKITTNVVWIDHHKSAIERYKDYPISIAGIRYDGVAGCMLTWCWFHTMRDKETGEVFEFNESMTNDAPMFTKYIADYDVWKFEYGENTKEFQLGLQLYAATEPEDNIWKSLLNYGNYIVKDIISDGHLIIIYRDNWSKNYCKNTGYEIEFEGYNCFVMNLAMISSEHFKSIEKEYDMFIGFSYNGKTWNYSLRSTTVDCSKIAMKYGGGGHKGAAGFNHTTFLLERRNNE